MVFTMADADDKSLKTAETVLDDIYYFGIGPVVNSQVRKRQRYSVTDLQAAILPEHRLTFSYGGIANVVKQRGYEVHGVLMKFPSDDDQWNRFVKTHTGYKPEVLEVFPYESSPSNDNDNCDYEEDESSKRSSSMGIQAYVFVLKEWDEQTLEAPVENIPSERYLKLIANGMRECNVDEDFVLYSIMSVPFVPSRKPEDYRTFPPSSSSSLPKITLSKYQKMCKRSTKTNNYYFVLGDKVFQVNKPFSLQNPGVAWIIEHCAGKGDSTFMIHQLLVEPGLPVADTEEEITEDHQRWAENQAVDFLENCGASASLVYELVEERHNQSRPSLFGRLRGRVPKLKTDTSKEEPS